MPKTGSNPVYEMDVDEVVSVPDCTNMKNPTHETNHTYSNHNLNGKTEPVYESPMSLSVAAATLSRENSENQGRRMRINHVYEESKDGTLPKGQNNDYAYVSNRDCLVARSSSVLAYDNPVSSDTHNRDKGHEYEESNLKNARFSQNVVYEPQKQHPIKIEGVRNTGEGKPKTNRMNRVQLFTLLLSILACVLGVVALLVASSVVRINNVKKETFIKPEQLKGERYSGEQSQQPKMSDGELEKIKEQVISSKKNYTELEQKYKEMEDKVNSLQQNNERLSNQFRAKLENITSTFRRELNRTNSTMIATHQQLNNVIQTMNSTFDIKLRNFSKELGPRGFNGSQGLQGLKGVNGSTGPRGPQGLRGSQGPQGPQGIQGVGYISACNVTKKTSHTTFTSDSDAYSTVTYKPPTGWKVISAVCSTKEDGGALHTVLALLDDEYRCKCAGPSKYGTFDALASKELYCIIFAWICPIIT
ncbi:uncharacterized protein LOC114522415 [Dendronephthya gigantea]|uniref:uncharacterized protein LOC114522415 n=1 Tax=Dendronephthya gigantea TaxID=151771 RepID=UPI00106D7AA0|nr:uncharacterized protein LOC114522415 [Dendronephthya gigantea]